MPGLEGTTIIAGGEDFLTPPLYKKLTSEGNRCVILDFSTSLSRQRERRAVYERLINRGVELAFADASCLTRDNLVCRGAAYIINLSDIFSDLDYEAFPAEGLKRNAGVALEIMESAIHAGVKRIVHISSGVVYGPRREQPLKETVTREAHDLQAAFKISAESIVKSYGNRGKVETVILRLFNAYGPGQSREAIVPYLIQGAMSGKTLPMGNSNHTRDFLYIDDMVDGIIAALAMPKAPGMEFNLASGIETSIKSLISHVEELTGQKLDVTFDPERIRIDRPDFPRWAADITLAKDILGFNPKWSLRDGLRHTIDNIKEPGGRWRE